MGAGGEPAGEVEELPADRRCASADLLDRLARVRDVLPDGDHHERGAEERRRRGRGTRAGRRRRPSRRPAAPRRGSTASASGSAPATRRRDWGLRRAPWRAEEPEVDRQEDARRRQRGQESGERPVEARRQPPRRRAPPRPAASPSVPASNMRAVQHPPPSGEVDRGDEDRVEQRGAGAEREARREERTAREADGAAAVDLDGREREADGEEPEGDEAARIATRDVADLGRGRASATAVATATSTISATTGRGSARMPVPSAVHPGNRGRSRAHFSCCRACRRPGTSPEWGKSFLGPLTSRAIETRATEPAARSLSGPQRGERRRLFEGNRRVASSGHGRRASHSTASVPPGSRRSIPTSPSCSTRSSSGSAGRSS